MFTPFDTSEIGRIANASGNPPMVMAQLLEFNQRYWDLVYKDEKERERHRNAIDGICGEFRRLEKACPHPTAACDFDAEQERNYYCNICGADHVKPGAKKLCE